MNTYEFQKDFVGTIAKHKGRLVKVNSVNERGDVFIRDFETKRTKTIYNSEYEDYSPVKDKIGYINIYDSAVYVVRVPSRQYKAGICESNLSFRCLPSSSSVERSIVLGSLGDICCNELIDAMQDKYPSFEKAMASIEGGAQSVAFARDLCIDHTKVIYFKNYAIGEVFQGKIQFSNEKYNMLLGDFYENVRKTKKG